jgi:hypothetical protein
MPVDLHGLEAFLSLTRAAAEKGRESDQLSVHQLFTERNMH